MDAIGEKYEQIREIFEEAKEHRFTWTDRHAPREYVKAKMLAYVHYVDMVQDIYPAWSLDDCCNILDISEHEYEMFKILTSCTDHQYINYVAAVVESLKEGYFTPVVVKYDVPEEPLRHIVEQHHRSALDMYNRIGLPVGWSEEQRHRAEMICSFWGKLDEEKREEAIAEELEEVAKEISEKFIRDGDKSLQEVVDDYDLGWYERHWCYGYVIGQIKVICYVFDNCVGVKNGVTRDDVLKCLGYTDEIDIQRFKRELRQYEEKKQMAESTEEETEIEPESQETYEITLSQEEIRHALELVIVVENVIDMLGIDKYEACKACETPAFVYDFAKQVEALSGGFKLRISDEEVDKLNNCAYRTACEIVEEHKAVETEKVKCMNRKENERIQKQRKIIRLCYGSGYKMRDLEELGIFDVDALEKEWAAFTEEDNWKYIVSDYSYDEILEEIRKHIGVRVATAMGMDVKRAAHYYNMSGPECCWATITAFQADRAGMVIPLDYIMAELDGLLTDIRSLAKKIKEGQLD